MGILFDDLALKAERMSKDDFLKYFSSPCLAPLRKYGQVEECSRCSESTSKIDVNLMRAIVSGEGVKEFPYELIPLTSKNNPKAKKITIGRNEENDIVINLPLVSKTHAVIEKEGGGLEYRIIDIGSSNDTMVNFHKLNPNESKSLQNGDLVCLGGAYNYTYYQPERLYLLLQLYLKKRPLRNIKAPAAS